MSDAVRDVESVAALQYLLLCATCCVFVSARPRTYCSEVRTWYEMEAVAFSQWLLADRRR